MKIASLLLHKWKKYNFDFQFFPFNWSCRDLRRLVSSSSFFSSSWIRFLSSAFVSCNFLRPSFSLLSCSSIVKASLSEFEAQFCITSTHSALVFSSEHWTVYLVFFIKSISWKHNSGLAGKRLTYNKVRTSKHEIMPLTKLADDGRVFLRIRLPFLSIRGGVLGLESPAVGIEATGTNSSELDSMVNTQVWSFLDLTFATIRISLNTIKRRARCFSFSCAIQTFPSFNRTLPGSDKRYRITSINHSTNKKIGSVHSRAQRGQLQFVGFLLRFRPVGCIHSHVLLRLPMKT